MSPSTFAVAFNSTLALPITLPLTVPLMTTDLAFEIRHDHRNVANRQVVIADLDGAVHLSVDDEILRRDHRPPDDDHAADPR